MSENIQLDGDVYLHTISAPEGILIDFVDDEASVSIDQPLAALAAVMVFGSIAILAIAIGPILLGGLVEAGRLTNDSLGKVATLEMLGIAAGSTVGPSFLSRGNFRFKAMSIAMALVVLNMACYRAYSETAIYIIRMLCGGLEGGALAVAILILTYTRNPEKMNGYFLGITGIPPVIGTYLLSGFIIPKFGVNAGFGILAATALTGTVASFGLSDRNVPAGHRAQSTSRKWGRYDVAAMLIILLQNAGIGAAFSYIVQLATQHNLPSTTVGSALACMNIAAVSGSFAVGWLAWRFNHVAMLTVGSLVLACSVLALDQFHQSAAYILAGSMFGLCWNGLGPFALKLLVTLDPTRRLALLASPLGWAGVGIGPFIASIFVTQTDVSPALWVSAGMIMISSVLYLIVGTLSRPAGAHHQQKA